MRLARGRTCTLLPSAERGYELRVAAPELPSPIYASISFKTIEQIASPSAVEETPRSVWGSIPSRHGRRIFWIAGVHTNAIRFAKPEGYSGSDPLSPPLAYNPFFFVHRLFLSFPLFAYIYLDESRTGTWAGSKSKKV